MAKTPTFPLLLDHCLTISIGDLRRWGCLEPGLSYASKITWNRGKNVVATVSYHTYIDSDLNEAFIRLNYQVGGNAFTYSIPLVAVPANIGKGHVWYFRCPFTRQRCKKLHLIEGRFVHRSYATCAMYKRQTESKKWRVVSRFLDRFEVQSTVEKAMNMPYFKTVYRGKDTRRFARLVSKVEKVESGISLEEAIKAMEGR